MASLCRQIVRGNALRGVLFSSARRGYSDKSKISNFTFSTLLHFCQCFSYVMSKSPTFPFVSGDTWKFQGQYLHRFIDYVVFIVITRYLNILAAKLRIPVQTSWHAIDLFWFCSYFVIYLKFWITKSASLEPRPVLDLEPKTLVLVLSCNLKIIFSNWIGYLIIYDKCDIILILLQ